MSDQTPEEPVEEAKPAPAVITTETVGGGISKPEQNKRFA